MGRIRLVIRRKFETEKFMRLILVEGAWYRRQFGGLSKVDPFVVRAARFSPAHLLKGYPIEFKRNAG